MLKAVNLMVNSGLQTRKERNIKGNVIGHRQFLINLSVFSAFSCTLHSQSRLCCKKYAHYSTFALLLHLTLFSLTEYVIPSESTASASVSIIMLISYKKTEKYHTSFFQGSNLRELSEHTKYHQNFSLLGERHIIMVPCVTLHSPIPENVANPHCPLPF